MLHMAIIKHTAESCPGRAGNEEVIPCVNRMNDLMRERGITHAGRWADPPGHANYLVLDAPSAHEIVRVLMDSGLSSHTTAEIRAVVSMD